MESVKVIQYYCGILDFTQLCDIRRLCFLHKMSVCHNVAVALKECFCHTDVDYLFYEYGVNFSLFLSAVSVAVSRKFADICGM